MTKKSKLFHGFNGDAAGLRDVLITHFKIEAGRARARKEPGSNGNDYAAGIDIGKASAFEDAADFLRKLVINDSEHIEQEPTP